jgi:hypothetical protein
LTKRLGTIFGCGDDKIQSGKESLLKSGPILYRAVALWSNQYIKVTPQTVIVINSFENVLLSNLSILNVIKPFFFLNDGGAK